jgi:hypothetical protein
VFYSVLGIARVDGVIHSTDPIFASVYELCCRHVLPFVCIPHVEHARQGYSIQMGIHSIQTEGVRGGTLSMQWLNAWVPFLW